MCTRSYGRCIPYPSLIPIADLFNHNNVHTVYYYAFDNEKLYDQDSQPYVEDYEDNDDPLVENGKVLLMSCLKLYKLSFASYQNLDQAKTEVCNEVLAQARLEDSQNFVKSIF